MSVQSSNAGYDCLLKYILIGDAGVGKSCFLVRYTDDSFSPNYLTSVGVDFKFKTMKLDDKTIIIQIWDTAGQEKFKTIISTYYKGKFIEIQVLISFSFSMILPRPKHLKV